MPEFSDGWMSEEWEALQPGVVGAQELEEWLALLASLRVRLRGQVPEPEVILLYALEARGCVEALTEAERRLLEARREQVEAALARHAGLEAVVDDIAAACDDFEAAWSSPAPSPSEYASDRAPRRRTSLYWQVGGAVAVAVALVVAIFLFRGDAPVVVTETGPDEVVRLELADGSSVRLMEGSRLAHPAEEEFERRVELTGQAYFDVQSEEAAFEVVTPSARALATGTSFGVRAGEAETEVVLTSGRLTLTAADEEVTLAPGEWSRVLQGQAPAEPEPVNLAEELAWTGLLIFRETSAGEIAERLAAAYDVSISVDSALEEEPVTGTFEQEQPIEEILGALAATLGAEVERDGNGFRLAPVSD